MEGQGKAAAGHGKAVPQHLAGELGLAEGAGDVAGHLIAPQPEVIPGPFCCSPHQMHGLWCHGLWCTHLRRAGILLVLRGEGDGGVGLGAVLAADLDVAAVGGDVAVQHEDVAGLEGPEDNRRERRRLSVHGGSGKHTTKALSQLATKAVEAHGEGGVLRAGRGRVHAARALLHVVEDGVLEREGAVLRGELDRAGGQQRAAGDLRGVRVRLGVRHEAPAGSLVLGGLLGTTARNGAVLAATEVVAGSCSDTEVVVETRKA